MFALLKTELYNDGRQTDNSELELKEIQEDEDGFDKYAPGEASLFTQTDARKAFPTLREFHHCANQERYAKSDVPEAEFYVVRGATVRLNYSKVENSGQVSVCWAEDSRPQRVSQRFGGRRVRCGRLFRGVLDRRTFLPGR